MSPQSVELQGLDLVKGPSESPSGWSFRSIRTKLVLAFAAIALLFLLAVAAAWTGFRALESNLRELETTTVPMATATQKLAIQVRTLDVSGLHVDELTSVAQLHARRKRFAETLDEVGGIASAFERSSNEFLTVLGDLGEVADRAFDVRERQLSEKHRLREVLDSANTLTSELVEDLERELIEARADSRQATELATIAELGVAIYSCGNLISRAGDAPDSDYLGELESLFRLESRRVTRLLLLLSPALRQSVSRAFDPIIELTAGLEGIFRRGAVIQSLGDEITVLNEGGTALLNALQRVVLESINNGRSEVIAARALADTRTGRARVLVIALTSAALLLSFAIIVFYVHLRVGHRLKLLCEDLYRLSGGDHDVEIRAGGDLELAQLAEAAEVFRKNAIQLRDTLGTLEQRNASLLEFAHVASHDLKSPMRAISNLASWVIEDCEGVLPEASAGHLTLIQERAIRMESLLEDLLRFSRLGNDERLTEEFTVKSLIEDVVDLLDVPESVTLTVTGGGEMIETIGAPLKLTVRNLIQNSIVHHDGEQPAIEVHVGPLIDGWVTMTFEDDGPGIPEEKRGEAFQIFRKLSPNSGGTGMGLALARRAVESMGGTIRVENCETRGVRFIVEWPASPVAKERAGTI